MHPEPIFTCPGKVLSLHGLAEVEAADDVGLFVLEAVVEVVPQVVHVLLDGAAMPRCGKLDDRAVVVQLMVVHVGV